MKKEYIIKEAKQVKEYVERSKKVPATNTYANGTIYSIYTTSYLFASIIRDWKSKSVDPVSFRIYNEKIRDSIDQNVLKDDYLVMIKNFINFCKKNNRVPAYITTQKTKTKVSFELFTYCLAKIVVYYAEHNALPNYCHFVKGFVSDSQSSKKPSHNGGQSVATCQNRINSAKGCEAMGQNNNYYCGVSALQKCLYKFGITKYSQKQLAQFCGTTTAGTSHQGLRTGIAYVSKRTGNKLSVKEAYFSDYTLKQLKEILCNPRKAIICHSLYRSKYGHYESWKAVDVDKKEIEVINSLGDKCPLGCFCGYIEHRSYSTQKQYCNGISQKSLLIITKE